MSKSRSFFSILIPSATVFFSSACIMVLELVAGRLIARHLGSSLYTWTSVIGVVLAGITIGNYLGGRIADRFPARKTLAVLFGISSVTCVVVVIMNNLVGEWILLWQFSWPMRVFSHVALVFLLPSTLLGMISPVVAKMALERGLPTGRTVGDIYAWGAAGSIVGTFLAGFYLIATIGTVAIIWTIGAALLLMGILYWARFWALYVWAIIFIALAAMGMVPGDFTEKTGASFGLREKYDPKVLYEDETQYCYIAVNRVSKKKDKREFIQDKLKHSEIIMGDIDDLQYFYHKIFDAITRGRSRGKDRLSAMVIGGGGYVWPRYVQKHWPGSRIDVVEIDLGVTEAAMQAFGLPRDTTINTITMDARNYVEELFERERSGEEIPRYDFIYEDAINDYSVPYQLVTKEFNDKISTILTDDGVYMVNLIDIFDDGLFLGAVVNTLKQSFPYVYVVSSALYKRSERSTFVVFAAKNAVELEDYLANYQEDLELSYLTESDMKLLSEKSNEVILTDDYAPVENLLAPVVRHSAKEFLAFKYFERAEKFVRKRQWEESIQNYQKGLRYWQSTEKLNELALAQIQSGKLEDAVETYKRTFDFMKQDGVTDGIAVINFNLGTTLGKLGKAQQAREYFLEAAEGFRKDIKTETDDSKIIKLWTRLGDTLASIGDFKGASEAFRRALALDPTSMLNYDNLVKALEYQGSYDEAIVVLQEGIGFMSQYNREDNAEELKRYLDFLEFKKAKQNK